MLVPVSERYKAPKDHQRFADICISAGGIVGFSKDPLTLEWVVIAHTNGIEVPVYSGSLKGVLDKYEDLKFD